jgi:hypothetical protein
VSDETPTPGELGRRLDDLKDDIRGDLSSISSKIDALPGLFVSRDLFDVTTARLDEKDGRQQREIRDLGTGKANEAEFSRFRTTLQWMAGFIGTPLLGGLIALIIGGQVHL